MSLLDYHLYESEKNGLCLVVNIHNSDIKHEILLTQLRSITQKEWLAFYHALQQRGFSLLTHKQVTLLTANGRATLTFSAQHQISIMLYNEHLLGALENLLLLL